MSKSLSDEHRSEGHIQWREGIFKGTDVQLGLPRKLHRFSMTGICGLEGE